jgi:hypothetical protein
MALKYFNIFGFVLNLFITTAFWILIAKNSIFSKKGDVFGNTQLLFGIY